MDEKELPSSSDESDEDFVPKDEDNCSDTGSEESDYDIPDGEDENGRSNKRKKTTKKFKKKARINETEEIKKNNEAPEEKKEVDVDALWADFKKDVDSLGRKKTAENSKMTSEKTTMASEKTNKSSQCSAEKNSANSKGKGNFTFPTRAKAGVGGLSKVLNQIGKKDKMSTLQKSQLDWNKFKKSEGIEEEIKMYNRGKDGYLEKQDFLQRTDLRQFEIEKDLRSARRKF